MTVASVAFQRISSDFGTSPFDKGLANRDVIVSGHINIINKLVRSDIAPGIVLAEVFRNEIKSLALTTFPGLGGFGPGGGTDALLAA